MCTLANLSAVNNEQTFPHLVNQLREEITRQFADLNTRITTLETSITTRLDARYHLYKLLQSRRLTILFSNGNIGARLFNSTINNPQTPFLELRDRNNQPIPGFPANGEQLAKLTSENYPSVL
jgi:alpha-galactosidase